MTKTFLALAAAAFIAVQSASAQSPDESVYIQLEARTSLNSAQASVRTYADRLQDVSGFALGGGWYGITIGPFTRAEAERQLRDLRSRRAIPVDSYIESADAYGRQFWPVGANAQRTPQPDAPQPQPEPQPAQQAQAAPEAAPVQPAPVPEETPREARASEAQLNRAERDELQIALQWAGFYQGRIDGAFGGGTRRSMAAWQAENGHDATGILTTRQRDQLLGQYYAVLEGMDLARYTDPRAGVAMELPMGVLEFDRYEAPFAIFRPSGDLQARALLISQPGDLSAMNGLYEVMQTLEIVPLEGERKRDNSGFVIEGANDRIVSHTEVTLANGQIKGFTLVWPAGDEERRTRVLGLMRASFERTEGVLSAAEVSDDGQSVDLVSGLKVRTAKATGSGFFIETRGTVLTSSDMVASCERITLNGVYTARVLASDPALGVAVLMPEDRLAPRRVAQFRAGDPRLQSEVAVAGFSFGGVLAAPTLTFGTLEDLRGLGGEEKMKRLALAALPGDVGGPVFDAGGTVLGMLLPRGDEEGRRLPDEVSFAAKGEMILDFLRDNGIQPVARGGMGPMAPEDLTALATDMTVLVGCW
ncbi:serine protease [Ponticoccus alexandrii]|uniref:Peptidoglycan-binding protein n=1 Tax=Ponticoccus alexandrii TaxID=1943633 RepID=A0ABX7FBB3_9RHOB|nr:serine protease [Ponticoccus alexandrii]ETA52927.1 peptidoglycan-binding protein [Rhodobacteraceae bacterium PD-2]QRF66849.1 peptidoglycan-binding protein [Ponticoccus alexandrii]